MNDQGQILRRRFLRLWRRLRRWGRKRRIRIIYHPKYSSAPTLLPAIDSQRASNILGFLAAEKLVGHGDVLHPRRVRMERLRKVHAESYLDTLTEKDALDSIYGVSVRGKDRDDLFAMHRSMAGGTLLAAIEALESGNTTVNLGGGFHHARRGRGAGFCLFNDVALAINLLRERGFQEKILVIDLDLHDGDGTRSFFADDKTVFTYSIHNHDLDDQEALASTAIALGDGIVEDRYLEAIEKSLPPLLQEYRPSFVFYIAGCDPAHDDKLGNWRITSEGMLQRDQMVMQFLRATEMPPPVVILLGGGYGPGSWRYTARFVSWLLTGNEVVEPLGVSTAAVAHYERLTSLLENGKKERKKKSAADWKLGSEDLPGNVQPRPRLLLGRYSLYAIELATDRLGLLRALRERGFSRLRFEFELDNPMGETVRLLEGDDRVVLMELRLALDIHTVHDATLLRVEWLALQNPRAQFDSRHPPLPGQKHPGLGLLRDIVALLILLCQDLQFDGLIFAPAHYHIAAQTERIFHFLDADDEALFLDLQETLKGKPLGEATRLVEEGRVRIRTTGEIFRWNSQPMLLTTSERLWRARKQRQYDRRVQGARRKDRFELI